MSMFPDALQEKFDAAIEYENTVQDETPGVFNILEQDLEDHLHRAPREELEGRLEYLDYLAGFNQEDWPEDERPGYGIA